jgi:hypothetical protein
MFNITNFVDIVQFIESNYKFNLNINWNKEWVVTFCPFCNDATRKQNPNHGHLNFHKYTPFVHCFRCSYSSSLSEFLKDCDFPNKQIILKISKYDRFSKFTHHSNNNLDNISEINADQYKTNFTDYCQNFRKYHFDDYIRYSIYMSERIGDYEPSQFFIRPNYYNFKGENILICEFLNYDLQLVSRRIVPPRDYIVRYIKHSKAVIYYYQPIYKLIDYKDIVVCEGPFDLINLYNTRVIGSDYFYISMNGPYYKKQLRNIISNFLMIGEYNIYIVVDNDLPNLKLLTRVCSKLANDLNSSINVYFYRPTVSKDVSEYMLIESF